MNVLKQVTLVFSHLPIMYVPSSKMALHDTFAFTCLLLWQTIDRGLGLSVPDDVRHTMIDRSRRDFTPSAIPLRIGGINKFTSTLSFELETDVLHCCGNIMKFWRMCFQRTLANLDAAESCKLLILYLLQYNNWLIVIKLQ